MRYIRKGPAPSALTDWIEAQRSLGVNLTFRRFPNPDKKAVRQALINDQLGLCAYTGKRLVLDTTTIEHVKPQSVCRREIEDTGGVYGRDLADDLSYANMLGVFKTHGVEYGEAVRHDRAIPVGPLDPSCETRFRYVLDGQIKAADAADVSVNDTIMALALDHESLVTDRARVLDGIFPEEILDSITVDELDSIAVAMITPSAGALPEFSFVVRSVALDLRP